MSAITKELLKRVIRTIEDDIQHEWVDFFVWHGVPTVVPWPTSLKVGGEVE